MAGRNLIKNLADNEIQIIGLEFTIRMPQGNVEELAMFSPQGLIIPRMRSNGSYGFYRPRVTFHTTDGDLTIEDYHGQCNW